jgi:hypothetical protein
MLLTDMQSADSAEVLHMVMPSTAAALSHVSAGRLSTRSLL